MSNSLKGTLLTVVAGIAWGGLCHNNDRCLKR